MKEKFLISILALNVKGQLGKMTTAFGENNLNILRLVLSAADKDDKIHKTIAYVEGEESYVDLFCEKMQKDENVLKVAKFKRKNEYLEKEICLVKVLMNNPSIRKILDLINDYKGKIAYNNKDFIVYTIEDTEDNINKVVDNLALLTKEAEVSRSGMVVVSLTPYIDEVIATNL